MAKRIITKGLKTGTGVGGVKFILMRGLVSASVTIQKIANLFHSLGKTVFYESKPKTIFYASRKL